MKLNFILYKNLNLKLNLVKFYFNLLNVNKIKRKIFLPFFSNYIIKNKNKKNFFFYNKSLLNSIFIKLKQNYFELNNGYFIELIAIGVGFKFYKFNNLNNILVVNLGYSHYIYYLVSKNISFKVYKNYLFLFSLNLNLLKKTALQIKNFKIPDIYKGKGIKYLKENLNLKVIKKKK